uniref:Uncharacterized protein n=1 Tax=Lepeophtheirus salmonis TaxID=72036 RepID=A0A0K2VBF0_LEPSM
MIYKEHITYIILRYNLLTPLNPKTTMIVPPFRDKQAFSPSTKKGY